MRLQARENSSPSSGWCRNGRYGHTRYEKAFNSICDSIEDFASLKVIQITHQHDLWPTDEYVLTDAIRYTWYTNGTSQTSRGEKFLGAVWIENVRARDRHHGPYRTDLALSCCAAEGDPSVQRAKAPSSSQGCCATPTTGLLEEAHRPLNAPLGNMGE